jgi:hypothetical protein
MDNTNAFGRVGENIAPDGVYNPIRLAKTGAVAVSQAHAKHAEAVSRGNVFFASNAVAGVAPGTALGTTPAFAIYNPPTSGVNLVMLRAYLGYVSGTLGAGTICLAQCAQTAAPTSGAALTVQNALLAHPAGKATAYNGSTIAGTPTIVRPSFVLGAFVDSAAILPAPMVDDIDGEIIVPPGNCLVIQGVTAAGTAPKVIFAAMWEEVPV